MKLNRLAWFAAAALASLLVFEAYLQPDLAVTLANQVWGCF